MGGTTADRQGPWRREFDDLVRGASGGFLFSAPLLYTMEVWWVGTYASARSVLAVLALTFAVVALLSHAAGFRKEEPGGPGEALIDATQAVALGLACTAGILLLLRRIGPGTPLDAALGKVVYEAAPFALGVALANQLLSGGRGGSPGGGRGDGRRGGEGALRGTLRDLGATAIGAVLIGFTIAPTEEVPLLAGRLTPPWLLALMAASLLLSYAIVFAAGFADQWSRQQQRGLFQRPLSETAAAYLVSLAVSAAMLWFFRQVELADPWHLWLEYTLVLGLPAAIGGAAGRLAV